MLLAEDDERVREQLVRVVGREVGPSVLLRFAGARAAQNEAFAAFVEHLRRA